MRVIYLGKAQRGSFARFRHGLETSDMGLIVFFELAHFDRAIRLILVKLT